MKRIYTKICDSIHDCFMWTKLPVWAIATLLITPHMILIYWLVAKYKEQLQELFPYIF